MTCTKTVLKNLQSLLNGDFYLLVKYLLMSGGLGTILMSEIKVMSAELKPRLLNGAASLPVRLQDTIIMLNPVGGSLIIKLILAQFIIMAAHDSDVAETFCLIGTLPGVFTVLV